MHYYYKSISPAASEAVRLRSGDVHAVYHPVFNEMIMELSTG